MTLKDLYHNEWNSFYMNYLCCICGLSKRGVNLGLWSHVIYNIPSPLVWHKMTVWPHTLSFSPYFAQCASAHFSLGWIYKWRLQLEHMKQPQCPLNVICFDHTLYVAAVTKNNQQRWARDSYRLMPDSLLMSLSLSLCSCCRFWRRKESIQRGSCGFQDLSPESRYNIWIHSFICLQNWRCTICLKQRNEEKWRLKANQIYWHCKMSEVLEQLWWN